MEREFKGQFGVPKNAFANCLCITTQEVKLSTCLSRQALCSCIIGIRVWGCGVSQMGFLERCSSQVAIAKAKLK